MNNRNELSKDEILEILSDLEFMIDAYDRISSNYKDDVNNALTSKIFFRENKIFRRLTKARRILSSVFSDDIDDDQMSELEREFEDFEYWELPKINDRNLLIERLNQPKS